MKWAAASAMMFTCFNVSVNGTLYGDHYTFENRCTLLRVSDAVSFYIVGKLNDIYRCLLAAMYEVYKKNFTELWLDTPVFTAQ